MTLGPLFRPVLEDLALIAHAVPPNRIRPLVNNRLALDTRKGPGGEYAFVGALTYRLRAPLQATARRRHGALFFVFVHREHEESPPPAIYLLRSYQGPSLSAYLMALLSPAIQLARWNANAGARPGGLSVEAMTENGRLSLDVVERSPEVAEVNSRATAAREPGDDETSESSESAGKDGFASLFDSPEELRRFFTERTIFYFWSRGHYLWRMRFKVREPPVLDGGLIRARLPFWHERGILSPSEVACPIAVYICRDLTVNGYCPIPEIAL